MNRLSILLIILFLSMYSIVSQGQVGGQASHLTIETIPPDSIIVCGDSAFFSVEITNTHSQQLSDLVFNPKMIPGMIYIAGSVTGMTEQNITTLNEPLFELNQIAPNQTIVLTFYAKAECSIIDQIINLGNGASSNGLATNQTRVDYVNNGTSQFSLELNGSDSYNILYADIFISTITNQVEQTIPGAMYTRSISIQNGGLGKIESLTLLIDFETGIAVSGTNIGDFNLNGQLATVTLGPAEFAMFGNGDGYFELDEVITLVDSVTMITCDGGETKYTAFWGCNALDTCQKDDAYANTILIGGQPILQSDIVVNEPTFFGCADTGVIVVEYNNVGIESSVGGANYYNVKLRYESNQEIVNYVGMQLNGVDLFAAGVPRTTVVLNVNGNDRERVELLLDNFFTTDPDGPGGLEDLDNDGYYDDMASGETLLATYQYLLESPMSFADCPTNFNYQFFRETIFGNNNCGMDIAGQISRNGHVQGYPDGAALVTGPSDIRADDTITITFENSFIFDEYGRFKSAFPSSFISTLKCDSSQVKTYLTMDPGFQIVPGSVLVNGLPATFTVNGSLVTIFGGALVGRQANNQISLDLTYDCSVPVTVGGILEWRSVLSCECGDEINLGCQDQFISRHCPGPPCFGTKDFVVNRASFGWTDDTQTTPVTASSPGVVLSRAYQCDTVCAYASGDVGVGAGMSLDNAHVNVWYRAPGLDRSFNYGRGEWVIFDASTGVTHRVPTSTPSFTTNGAPASTHQMTFDATSAITGTVGTLEDGDSLNLKLYLEVNKTSDFPLGAYQFPRFRAQHAYIDAVGDTITCSSFGAGFTILKTKTLIQTQSGSTNLGNFAPCGEHNFLFGSKLIGGLGVFDDFPNEFRPVNVWDDTLCYTLPQGVYYVPGTIQFNNGPASTVSPLFDPATRKLTFIGSELYADGWPLLDRVDDRVRTIEFRVSRDCDAIVGNNIIPSQYGYTDYSYAQDPSCYEHNVANTDWDITIDKPKLEMDASLTVIEGFDRELKWTVRLCNNGNIFSNNNWVYINDTSSNLTISSIIDLSNGGISVPFTQVGTLIYINVGMILESSCIDLEISSLNSDCTPGQLHGLEVFSGWSCTPDSMYNPAACHTDTIPLQYITKRANLQTQVTFPVGNMIDICAPFDFDVLLISSLEGSMGDISHFIELPVGLSIQPGATYVYPLGTAPQALPAPTPQFGGNLGWDLSAIIPGLANSFVGTNDTTRNKLRLNYSLVAGCDFDPYNLIGINSHGYTNCNELVDLTARKKIIINGFPQLDTTEVSLSLVDNSSTCVNQVSAVVNVENQSMGNLGLLNNLEVTLPAGMSYVMGSHIPDPVVQAQGGGVDRLTFTYPNPLASGATATFNFELELDQTLTCGPYSIIARSIVRDSALCVAAGQNCEIGATTGVDTAEIAIQTTIDPSFASSVVEPCLGDSFNLTSVATCGTHFWDFGDGNTSTDVNPTHTYNGATGGLYTITHIITSNCSADTNVTTINVLDQCCQLSLSLTATAINCNGNCDGTTTVVASNGTAPYTYLWSNLSTSATATNLCAGAYSVTVIDAAGCSETGTVNVTDNTVLFEGTISSTNISCAGTCDGTAAANLIGGVAPYTYAWSDGSTSSSLSGLCAGTYSVTGTDANGCVVVITTVITEPAAIVLTTTSTGINNCTGTCDGTASTSVTGGTAPYAYAWSNGGTGSSLNALCAGTYSVTATDANGCSSVGTVNVDSVAVLAGTISSTNVSCAGTCDGTAAANLTSGTAPYTYAWSNGATSSSLTGLCAGTYSVTGTDVNGCVVVLTTVITEPVAMILNTTSTGINNCTGICDGTATTSVTGGTAPYTYAWSNGSTSSSLTGLCAGTYSVTTTDANGCATTSTATVNGVVALSGTTATTDVLCGGTCNGTATANVVGGTAPYTYAWSTGATTNSLSGLCGGTYTVVVTDANACDVTLTALVMEPAVLVINATATGTGCYGNCDGTATVSVSNGTAPYTYLWSNLSTTETITNLCAGTYGISVTDANGCSKIGMVIVDSMASLEGNITSTNATCAGTCDGTASTAPIGGTAPYTFAWSNGSTASSLSNLCAGTYVVTITDANGCDVALTTVVTEPTALSVNVITTDASCSNNMDSSTCVATAWRNNRHAVWLPNLPNTPDNKFVFESNSGRLHEYPNGTARITGTIVNRSNPNQRWAVDVHFTNGMNWTNWSALGRSYKDQSGLAGQNYLNWTYYIMDVTKSNTLTGLGSYSGTVLNLTHRPANYTYGLQVGLGANDKDGDYGFSTWFRYTSTDGTLRGRGDFNADLNCASTPVCDGTAQVNTTGGTAPYTYTWSNGSTGSNLNGLCADTFNVTVTDANGCSTNTIVIIDAEQCCNVSIAATHADATCAGTCDGTITTTPTGGTAPYTYAWSNGSTNSSLNTLCAGTYTLTVTDANGCEAMLTTVITEPTALAINVTTTDVSCNPGVDSTICVITEWRNGRHAVKLPDLPNTPDSKFIFENNSGRLYEYPDGTARITGTLVNNSDATKRFAVDVHFTNGMDWTSWSALGRNYRDQSGTAGQNYLDWTYYIMDATKSNTLTGLGVYSGTVLNLSHRPANYNFGLQVGIGANSKDTDYGFAWWFDYTVTGPACIAGRGNFNADINCTDVVSCDGTAQVNTTGGTAPYTYNWSNGSSNDSLNGLCADTLTLTVTDANGCSTSTVVVIEEEDCCSSSTTVTNTSCPGSCDGTINVINTNGTAPYTYQWNNGASGCILNNVCAGTYTVTVTDANGCVSIVTTVVTSPDPIVVTVGTVTVETCTGSDATATINVTGGTAPYTIDLANFTTGTTYSNSTGVFTGLNAGQHLVNVIDANGCTIECATTFVVETDCCTPGTNVAPGTGANVSNPTLRINSTPSVIQINYETSEKVTGISILDANGEVFLNNEALHGTGNLEIPRGDLKGNTYWIILRGDNNRLLETKKLILSE